MQKTGGGQQQTPPLSARERHAHAKTSMRQLGAEAAKKIQSPHAGPPPPDVRPGIRHDGGVDGGHAAPTLPFSNGHAGAVRPGLTGGNPPTKGAEAFANAGDPIDSRPSLTHRGGHASRSSAKHHGPRPGLTHPGGRTAADWLSALRKAGS